MSAHPFLICIAVLPMLVSTVATAESNEHEVAQEDAEPSQPPGERYNLFLFGFTNGFRLLQDRGAPDSTDLGRAENVYGFLFGYERIVHPFVAVSIVKPFYFNSDRVDSQLEIVVTGIFRKKKWEPFVGGGVVSLLSRLKDENKQTPGDTIEFAVGLLFITGFKYFFAPRWAFEFEFGYEFIPKDANFEHGFAGSYQGAYFF
jgi:hypothetical protein